MPSRGPFIVRLTFNADGSAHSHNHICLLAAVPIRASDQRHDNYFRTLGSASAGPPPSFAGKLSLARFTGSAISAGYIISPRCRPQGPSRTEPQRLVPALLPASWQDTSAQTSSLTINSSHHLRMARELSEPRVQSVCPSLPPRVRPVCGALVLMSSCDVRFRRGIALGSSAHPSLIA